MSPLIQGSATALPVIGLEMAPERYNN